MRRFLNLRTRLRSQNMDGQPDRRTSSEPSESLRRHQAFERHRAQLHVTNTPAVAAPTVADCWCISTGMAGMNSQTSGLANAVGLGFEFKDTHLRFPWNCMPLACIPRAPWVMRNPDEFITEVPPKLVVSCGRHGVIPALYLRKRFDRQVFLVHLQDPTINPALFDLVVAPKHDGVSGPNVYETMGAIHYVTPDKLAAASRTPEAAAVRGDGSRPVVAVLLGGPNNYYAFSLSDLTRMSEKLKRMVQTHSVRLAVLKSRRTPQPVADLFQREFGADHFVWDGTGTNPYFAAMAQAKCFVCTGDSVSMITEASSTGRPVLIEHLTETRRARRFRLFHQQFSDAGITRPFNGALDEWSYDTPHDTTRIAEIIRERMGI